MAQKESAPQTAAAANPGGPKGNLYAVTQAQLDRAARAMHLDPDVYTILSQPKNELIVNFPVRMDGITFNPRLHSRAELERITRRDTHALGDNIGPELDIPARATPTSTSTAAASRCRASATWAASPRSA